MKKLYTYLSLGILFLASYSVSSQVLIPENFEGTSATVPVPPGWAFVSSPAFQSTTTTPCEGSRSVRALISSSNQNAILRSLTQVATGDDIEVSFDYKLINETGGGATPTTFGNLQLQYTVNANATSPVWATYQIIDGTNHTASTSCATHTATIPATSVPAGSNFAWRVRTNWAAGSYFLFIDDFLAVEQVDCIEPIYMSVDNVTFDEADVHWTDLSGATQWEIEYGTVGFSPGFPPPLGPFGTIVFTNNEPTTITGLDDGEAYDVYVRAICGPGDVSNWAGPITFQTIAIGTDCNTPIEITSLPYNSIGNNTTVFGNSYTGSPGTGCFGNNFLQGFDVVYKYTSTTDDYLNISVSDLLGEDNVGVFVYENCADIGNACYAGNTTTTGDDFQFDIFVGAGDTIYLVLSSAGINTSTEYSIDIKGFDCASWNAPAGQATYEFFGQQLSAFDDTNLGVQTTNDFADLNWFQNNAGVPGAPIPDTSLITLVNGDIYWVNQSLGACDSPYLMVTFTEFDCLNQLAILTTNSGAEICGEGTTTISATGNTDNLFWYENQFGGDVRGTGNTFVTDNISVSTSYWVSEAFIGQGALAGQANPGPTTVSTSTLNNYGVRIGNITTDFTLVDVQVFSTAGGGPVTVELRETSGAAPTQSVTVSIPAGTTASPTPFTIPLDFDLVSGASYQLIKTNGTGPAMIYALAANTSFPYPVGNAAEVTTGSTLSGNSNNYYYFFNWTITEDIPLCESLRTEVIAIVNEIFDIEATTTNFGVCVNQNATLNASSVDTDYVYTWEWTTPTGTTQTATGAQIQPTIVQTTTFTVTGFNPITGCTSPPDTIEIEAIGAGEIPVTPQIVETCVGNIVELNAGGFYSTFNEQVSGWTVTNTSTGPGNPGAAGWKLVNSPFNPAHGATSNDNSQFYIATADAVGPSGSVNTQLTSPSINLVGVQNASLNFYHYYDHQQHQPTQARVQISEGNGDWVTLEDYGSAGTNCPTCDRGTPTNWAMVNIDLSSYTGAANVRIRFNYEGDWGWRWAVDNVTITRDYTNGQVSWAGTSNLYLDDAATVPYTGSSTNKVYYKGDAPGTFTYDVELNVIGCGNPITNSVTITVNETLAPVGPALQDYEVGNALSSLNVTGQDLRYYTLVNGTYTRISLNSQLIHGTTYYITQTQNGCESDYLEVTVNLECPEPTNVNIDEDDIVIGANGDFAVALVTWTEPANTTNVQSYYIEVRELNVPTNIYHQSTTPEGTASKVIQGLDFDKDYILEMYSICDPSIPVRSLVASITFDIGFLNVTDVNFQNLTYYPNPTSDIVTYENSLPIDTIEIYSITGQKLIEQKVDATSVHIDFSSFSTGVYFSKIQVGDSFEIVRIIRN